MAVNKKFDISGKENMIGITCIVIAFILIIFFVFKNKSSEDNPEEMVPSSQTTLSDVGNGDIEDVGQREDITNSVYYVDSEYIENDFFCNSINSEVLFFIKDFEPLEKMIKEDFAVNNYGTITKVKFHNEMYIDMLEKSCVLYFDVFTSEGKFIVNTKYFISINKWFVKNIVRRN